MKDNYLSSLADFEILCSTAIDLSITTQGREVETWREEYASHIFS